jgi:GntR family transcriptional regulator
VIFHIDSTSSVPVYAQIVEQVKRAIASGVLQKGEALPSRRELALELEINPLTVLKAYKELEVDGLITIKQGLGCFVTASPDPAVDKYRTRTLTKAMDQLISDARAFGIPLSEIEEMLHERIKSAQMDGFGGENELKRA